MKFDRLYKKIIKEFTTITTGIYKNEFWKFRKQIEIIRNSLDMLYHTYLNLMMTGEIELNDINKELPEWQTDPQVFISKTRIIPADRYDNTIKDQGEKDGQK